MSTLQDSDLFIVDRNGTNYQLPNSQMSTVQDTDLFVVERDGVNYKVEGKDVAGPGGSFDQPVSVLTPLNGAGLNAGQSYEPLSSTLVSSSPSAVTINFTTTLYAGNGGTQEVSTGVDNTGKSLVWVKNRTAAVSHVLTGSDLVDAGYTNLASDLSNAAGTESNYVTSLSSNGFSVGNSSAVNNASQTYVAWNFRAAPGFMEILTYNGGTDVVDNKIPHSLGVEPAFMIFKPTSGSGDWWVYHKDMNASPENYAMVLNDNNEATSSPQWNNTKPTSTEVSLSGNLNSNLDYIAYLFASDDTNIKCGGYRGNNSNSNLIECGFKPGWVMIKRSSDAGNWVIFDVVRGDWSGGQNNTGGPGMGAFLQPNQSDAENESGELLRATDTGFELRTTYSEINANSDYIFVAIADTSDVDPATDLTFVDNTELAKIIGPVRMVDVNGDVKTPVTSPVTGITTVAGSSVFTTTLYTGDGVSPRNLVTGIDNTVKSLVWIKNRQAADNNVLFDSLRNNGINFLYSNTSGSETVGPTSYMLGFNSDGVTLGDGGATNTAAGQDYVAWNWKAAPGFFDIVTYEGTNATQEIPHQLSSTPGLIITKNMDAGDPWTVYHKDTGANQWLYLNESNAASQGTGAWNNTNPTSTHFTLGDSGVNNRDSNTHVAYLFADTPGLIKCGSYTGGTGSANVQTGFAPGLVSVSYTHLRAHETDS